jgi:alpha-D-xyloside xylohydrolase
MPWEKHGCTDEVRELFRTRMSLVPYLFNAFYEYYTTGKPPVRALVCDFGHEAAAKECGDQYLFGDSMIVAPIISGTSERDVWLPEGEWFDFFTGEKFEGGTHHRAVAHIPVYVKGGTLLPVAKPINYIEGDTCLDITLRAYGECGDNAVCKLVADSDETHNATYTVYEINKNMQGKICERYNIVSVEEIK